MNEVEKLRELFEINDENIDISYFYIDYLEYAKNVARKISKYKGKVDGKVFLSSVAQFLEIEDQDWLKDVTRKYELDDIVKLDERVYMADLYYQNINVTPVKKDNWELKYLQYDPYEGFVYNDTSLIEGSVIREKTHIGYFENRFKYLAALEDGVVWMSITPNEIETMREPIRKAKGDVLTYGLGLGYYAYMVSMKDDVSSLTIVERDQRAIDLFRDNILSSFKHKDKIKIVKEDAFNYVKEDHPHDFVFVDLWHTVDDGLEMYVKMLKLERVPTEYWIEDSMLAMARRCLVIAMEEESEGVEEGKNGEVFSDRLINAFRNYLRVNELKDYDDVIKSLDRENIKLIVKTLEI